MKRTQKSWFVLLIVCLAFQFGCDPDSSKQGGPGGTATKDATNGTSSQATERDIAAAITDRGSITFLSWNGKWIGMDGDTDLTFLPDGKAHMFEYGDAVSSYNGTYTIDAQGVVTMNFPTFGRTWPKMELRRDSQSLFLRPVDDRSGFIFGNRGGVTISGGSGNYWPFRPIPFTAEVAMRESISKPRE